MEEESGQTSIALRARKIIVRQFVRLKDYLKNLKDYIKDYLKKVYKKETAEQSLAGVFKDSLAQSVFFIGFTTLLSTTYSSFDAEATPQAPPATWVIEAKGAVSPAMSDYITSNLEAANDEGVDLFVIKIDTPGGLDQSMRSINKAILASEVPVATWVAPSGSRAASAGTYILYASHIASMAPATNLGAATPVNLGSPQGTPPKPKPMPNTDVGTDTKASTDTTSGKGTATANGKDTATANGKDTDTTSGKDTDEDSDEAKTGILGFETMSTMERKMTQDAVAYIRSLAQLRGRNIDWAQDAVGKASSLSAEDAQEKGVIDFIAADLTALLSQIDGRNVNWNKSGETRVVQLSNKRAKHIRPNWRDEFLAFVSNPNFAFIMLSVGAWALIIELYTSGVGLGMVFGVICLSLAFYGLQVLPVSGAGLALLLFGIALMVAEVFIPSFGVFGIGGMVAFCVGAIFLMDTDNPEFQISINLIIGMTLATAVLFVGGGWLVLNVMRRKSVSGIEGTIGNAVLVATDFDASGIGKVKMAGENWKAEISPPEPPPRAGDTLYVQNADSLVLKLQREPLDLAGVSASKEHASAIS